MVFVKAGTDSGGTVVWLKPFRRGNYQFFREWAAAAWARQGGRMLRDWRIPLKLRMVLGKAGLVRPFPNWLRSRRRVIVAAAGRVEYYCWPACYRNEIVPVLWDCWPKYWDGLVRFVRTNRIRILFCTSSQTADMIREKCPGVEAVWLPEGIDTSQYPMGAPLKERPVDVLEIGRTAGLLKASLADAVAHGEISYLHPTDDKLLFRDFAALTAGLRNAKMTVCLPRCDTHPQEAGMVETLTQRYWECMLSGTLIVGRAPKELVDFCGYDPVIALGDDPAARIREVLADLPRYQELADKNRRFAETHADWSGRMEIIRRTLQGNRNVETYLASFGPSEMI